MAKSRAQVELVHRFQMGFGSLALGEAVFDRYGRPLGFVRSLDSRYPQSEVIDFSAAGSAFQRYWEPEFTLVLTNYAPPQGKEVKYMANRDIDLYDDEFGTEVTVQQFGRYGFGLDKLADALTKGVELEAITKDEAKREFRQFVTILGKDKDKAKKIADLEKKLEELQSGD